MTEKVTMTVVLPDLTRAQAIALHAMFEHWRQLGKEGSSRKVSFYVDGDGDFRPDPRIKFSADPYPTSVGRSGLRDRTMTAPHYFDFGTLWEV